MATQADMKDAILDYGLEEPLFAGVVDEAASLESVEGLLGALRDVDVRGPRQRTLLHLAVRAGRVDWVQRLLGMGADPGLRDADGHTVADVADDISTWFPEEEDRPRIREMVLGKLGQDGAPGSAATVGRSPPGGDACGNTEVTKGIKDIIAMVIRLSESLDSLSTEMTSLKSIQLQHFDSASADISVIKEEIATLSKDAAILKCTVKEMRAEVKSQIERQLGLEDAVKEGMHSAINEVKDVKASLTSLVEEWRPWKEQQNAELQRFKGDSERFKSSIAEIHQSVKKCDKEKVRDDCISAMMAKTAILDSNDERIRNILRVYERLYSESQQMSRLLTFLQFQPEVKIRIDCSSGFIDRMKETFTDRDRVEERGSDFASFADLEEDTADVGGGDWSDGHISGYLASALAQVAVSLAFRNGGRPYRLGDVDRGREMGRVVQAAEEERRKGRLEYGIRVALDKQTQSAKETYLIAAVPWIIAYYGSTEGASILSDQVPSLLTFYDDLVHPALSP